MKYVIDSPSGWWCEDESEFLENGFTIYDTFEEADAELSRIYRITRENLKYAREAQKENASEFLAQCKVSEWEEE